MSENRGTPTGARNARYARRASAAPYNLALIRDGMGQGGVDEGLKLSKGLRVGQLGAAAGQGDLWLENSVRYSTCLSSGISVASFNLPVSGTWSPIQFDTEVWDTDEIADLATYNTRLTVKTSGVYHAHGYCNFGASAVGYRGLNIRRNGTTALGAWIMTAMATGNLMVIDALWLLVEEDYLELCGLHDLAAPNEVVNVVFSMARIP